MFYIGEIISVVKIDGTEYTGGLKEIRLGADPEKPTHASIILDSIEGNPTIGIHIMCADIKEISKVYKPTSLYVFVLLSHGKIVDWYRGSDEHQVFYLSDYGLEIKKDSVTYEMKEFKVNSIEEETLFYSKWSNDWMKQWNYIEGYSGYKFDDAEI